MQRVEVTQKEERDPAALTLEYVQLMAEHPELREAMAAEVAAHQALRLPEGEAGQGEDESGNAGG